MIATRKIKEIIRDKGEITTSYISDERKIDRKSMVII